MAYELGFKSLFPSIPIYIFIAIVIYFSIDVNRMVNRVGKYLTPILVILLLGIIIKDIFTPLGIPTLPQTTDVFKNSFLEGYQTGDLLVSYLIGTVFIGDIIRRGYNSNKERNKYVAYTGIIALVLLAVIYVGLIYLGASVSAQLPSNIDRSDLLVTIAQQVLGKEWFSAFSLAVVLACITTAIGQIISIANFFHEYSNQKINHKGAVVFFSLLSGSIAILGVDKIIYYATPIYLAVYPSVIVLMFLGIFRKLFKTKESFRYALLFTLIISILEAILAIAKTSSPFYP